MLRTMGSTLLAKANSGGALRKTEEANIENPSIPGKGAIGTISRAGLEQPIERQVPPGSTKVVSSAPSVEGTVAPSGVLPTQPLADGSAPGVGLPMSTPRSGAGSQAMPNVGLTGGPTLRSGATGAKTSAISGGPLAGAGANVATQKAMGAQSSYQATPSDIGSGGNSLINAIAGNVGGKVIATDQNKPSAPAQTRSGIANIAQKVGAPQGVVRSLAKAEPIGNAVRSAITAPVQVGQAIANQIKSGGAIGQAVQKVSALLRSLFR